MYVNYMAIIIRAGAYNRNIDINNLTCIKTGLATSKLVLPLQYRSFCLVPLLNEPIAKNKHGTCSELFRLMLLEMMTSSL